MRQALIIVAGLGIAGCSTVPRHDASFSPFIYPQSAFVVERVTTRLDDLAKYGDITKMLIDAGAQKTDIPMILADPFFKNPVREVDFQSYDPLGKIARYYEDLFKRLGWRKVRGILITEHIVTDEWGGVYEKAGKRFLIHTAGPWRREAWEKDPWNAQPRGISFSFVQSEPKEILGTNYQDKKSTQVPGRR
jgi:hypothetical protein